MELVFSVSFAVLSVGCAIILVFALFRIIQREKLVEGILSLSFERRNRYITAERNLVRLLAVLLLPLSSLLIVFPLSLFFLLRSVFISGTIFMVLMVVTDVQEYLFRKWVLNRIEQQENP